MSVFIVREICNGCGMCVQTCPNAALSVQLKMAVVDQEKCVDCEECVFTCPVGAITGGEPEIKGSRGENDAHV